MQTCHHTGAPFPVSRSFATIPLLVSCIPASSTPLLLTLVWWINFDLWSLGRSYHKFWSRICWLESQMECLHLHQCQPSCTPLTGILFEPHQEYYFLLDYLKFIYIRWKYTIHVNIQICIALSFSFPCLNLFWKEIRCYILKKIKHTSLYWIYFIKFPWIDFQSLPDPMFDHFFQEILQFKPLHSCEKPIWLLQRLVGNFLELIETGESLGRQSFTCHMSFRTQLASVFGLWY